MTGDVGPQTRAETVAALELIRLPTIVRCETAGPSAGLSIMVGHTFGGIGVLAAKHSVVRRSGGHPIPPFQNGVQRGHIGVSGASLYGYTPALTSMHTAPGDSVILPIDVEYRTAELREDHLVDSL